MNLLHEQYETDGKLVLFKCDHCGRIDMSLGSLHSHIQGHYSMLRMWSGLIPFLGKYLYQSLHDDTTVLKVESVDEITLDDVEGL